MKISNITDYLYRFAEQHPDHPALLYPRRYTFGELVSEIDRYSAGFREAGLTKGVHTLVLINPGIDLFAISFALFRIGAIPVMIDPGMGIKRMTRALAGAQIEAIVGIPRAHLLRYLSHKSFSTVHIWISTGFRWFWRGKSLRNIKYPNRPSMAQSVDPDDIVAIFFTSGSTGMPKGVLYKRRMLEAQIKYLQFHFKYNPREIDLCTFPLIGLLIICHGIPIVLADMDMTHPAKLNPRKVFKNIHEFGCTHMFCSPMVLNRLSEYGIKNNIKTESMKRIMTAGAPVSGFTLREFRKLLPPDSKIHTPFGATEALPVTDIMDDELLRLYNGISGSKGGLCVGYPLEGMEIRIIAITDEPVIFTNVMEFLAEGEIGEIILRGPNVSESYWENETANQLSKIVDPVDSTIWHRMEDLGRIDQAGRLWFYGRKAHRVVTKRKTYFTIPVEAVFNQHPDIERSALVGVKKAANAEIVPVICIELRKNKKRKIYLHDELGSLACEHEAAKGIEVFLFHKEFPVDPRHNAKIFREKLALWANKRLRL